MDRTEEREQALFIKWTHRQTVRAAIPELAHLHHSPNGGRRDAITGAQMVALGVKRGWPDLVLPLPGGGLAIEFKSATGRTTAEQDAWLAYFERIGWRAAVVRSAPEAVALIAGHFGLPVDALPGLEA